MTEPRAIADAYERMPHSPADPEVARAYEAFTTETAEQWHAMHARGVVARPWQQEGQPYADSAALFAALDRGEPLHFFTGGDLPANHPLAAQSGSTVDGVPLTFNDVFRAVHDVYGHYSVRASFGPKGEEAAYQEHRRWFSPLAQLALRTETQGQNSWFNYGPHLRRPDGSIPAKGEHGYIAPAARPFADQKANIVARYIAQ